MKDVESHASSRLPPSSAARLTTVLCVLALLLFVATRCLVPMDETDLFFNLRLGDVIRARHAVPRTNLLSFTYPDTRDINLAWLFQILLSWAHQGAGIPGTVILKTAFVAATFGALFYAAHAGGADPLVAALVLALSAWAAEPRFVERPHLVTFLGLALLCCAVVHQESRPSSSRSSSRSSSLAWFVPWGLAWSNANSCFFLAVGGLLLYALGAAVDGRRAQQQWALRAAAIFAPCLIANPSGLHTFRYLANHWRMPSLRPLQEYRLAQWPLDAPFFFLAALFVVSLLLRASTPLRESRATPSWLGRARARALSLDGWRFVLPICALGLLGSRRIRFVAEFALMAGPVTAVWLSRLRPSLQLGRWAAASRPVAALVCVGLALLPKLAGHTRGEPWLDLAMEPGLVPQGAIDYLEANDLRGRLYHDMEVGSYLTWDEAARGLLPHPVFQDPRINSYPDELHAVLRRADLGAEAWQAFLDRWQVRAALLCYPESNPRAAWFSPDVWALVYRASDALVFVRRSAVAAALLARDELPFTFGHTAQGATFALALGSRPATLPLCLWHQRLADFALEREPQAVPEALDSYRLALGEPGCLSPEAARATRATAANLALQLGQPQVALNLAGVDPAPELGAARGLAQLALRDWQAADESFSAVLAREPHRLDALLGGGLAREKLGLIGGAVTLYEELVRVDPSHAGAEHARAFLQAHPPAELRPAP